MANQMIALQARAPQAPDLGGLAARYGNMMAQQRTAERQTAVAQQQMDLARAEEARKVAGAGRDAAKFDLEQLDGGAKFFRDNVGKIPQGDVATAQALIDIVGNIAPAYKSILPRADKLANDPNERTRAMMKAEELVAFTTTKKQNQVVSDLKGKQSVASFGGELEGQPYSAPVMELEPDPNASAATPTAAAPAVAASPEQLGAAAQYLLGNSKADISDPALRGLSPEDLTRAQGLADQMRSGGRMQPISMNTGGQMAGGQGQPDMGAIVQDMFATGVISQSNMNALEQFAGPQKTAQMKQIMQAKNIQIMSDEPAAPAGMRNAVFRPEEGAAQMQLAQNVPQGMRISNRQLQGRDTSMGQYPGTAQVPIPRIRQEAAAQRPSAKEAYDVESAKERAKYDAAANAPPKRLTSVQEAKLRDNIGKDFKSAQAILDKMLAPDAGVIAAVNAVRKLSPDQKEALTGFSNYVPSILPSSRSADTALKNLMGKATDLGKSEAALSGAIGSMAVQEWRIVRDLIATLDVASMEPADLDNQLDIIEATARRLAQTTRDAYENQYAEEFARFPNRFVLKEPNAMPTTRGKPAEAALPRVRTDADFMRLKPGTLFIDPDGQTRRKP
jgi:hypothetical protein